MDVLDAKKAGLKELELNALLEVTEAINNNLPEASLYKIYHFTLLANLKVRKLALFVKADQWEKKVSFGFKGELCDVSLGTFENLTETVHIKDSELISKCFQIAIPVLHKNNLLAVVLVGDVSDNEQGEKSATTFLEALTNILLVAIENKKLARYQLEQEALAKELEIAKNVQQNLFPNKLPSNDKLEVSAFYQPHHNVGGDYYDFINLNDNQFIACIADVSGKGVPAALMMSNFQASLRTLVRQTNDLEIIVNELNYQLAHSGNSEIFITFFIVLYDVPNQRLEYINCGHNIPILLSNDKNLELNQGTTVLGMFNPLPFLTKGLVENMSDFTLFCYTDGLNEAFNQEGEEFGEERIHEILNKGYTQAAQLNHEIMKAVNTFRGEAVYRDDVTLLTIKVKS